MAQCKYIRNNFNAVMTGVTPVMQSVNLHTANHKADGARRQGGCF